jgi:methylphosphotriester-DNA--protein-cysteine methyltransferase
MALISCPLCKAENAQGPACRRCKADLSMLFRLEEQRAWTFAEAGRLLAAGRIAEANSWAQMADWLRSDAESLRLFALTRLLLSDFHGAWRCYRALENQSGVGGSVG